MSPLTEEAKLTILGLTVAAVVLGGAYAVTELLAAGRAENAAKVEQLTIKATADAARQTATWQARASAAELAHQGELNALKDRLLVPTAVSVSRLTLAGTAAVSANPAAAGSDHPATGEFHANVVCESPGLLRIEFAEAQRADALAADARELFDAWPISPLMPPR